jgi:hypothetical protein
MSMGCLISNLGDFVEGVTLQNLLVVLRAQKKWIGEEMGEGTHIKIIWAFTSMVIL